MAENYEISLGIGLNDSDFNNIKTKIKSLEDDTVKIKLDTKEADNKIDDLKKQLQDLNKVNGNKPSLDINTVSLEKSLDRVATAIEDIKKSLSTVDGKSGMQSLLSSINQITTALGKAESETDSLVKSLSSLSKKDFSFNFNLKSGNSNPVKAMTDYGREARNRTIPVLQEQAAYLQDLLGGYDKADRALQNYLVKIYKLNGANVKSNLLDDMADTSSLSKQMDALERYVGYLKKIATLNNKDLSGFDSTFSKSADKLVDDTVKIQTGAKQAEEELDKVTDKLKQVFGSGIDVEGLSTALDPILQDLKAIREAIGDLSKGISIDGLTNSFNRLSEVLDKLDANFDKIKNLFNSDLTNIGNIKNNTNKIEQESDSSTSVIVQNEKKKQAAYKATTDAVMYHAGIVSKLNKAETNGRFYGSNRGTGYFGTGHYFVDYATKHELDSNENYNKLPYTSIDISQYDNLFKATSDEIAGKLHSFLANLTSFTQGGDSYDVSELFTQFKSVFGDTIMDIKEFGLRLDQLKTFMSNSSMSDRSDSVSTQFMKSLGYGGVDTRGTKYADTRYGTVIYDLKEESVLQANITDELQKQGQMLEKINYEKGQVFDQSEDNRIQSIIDQQAKQKEIIDEYQSSFDSTNFDKANSELTEAKNRLREIDDIIAECQYSIDNAEQEAKQFAKTMKSIGLDMSDDEIKKSAQSSSEGYKNRIEELTKEREEIQSRIPALEEVYNKEEQLSNKAFEQARQVVEQRRQQAQESKNFANSFKEADVHIESTENQIEDLENTLRSFGLNDGSIDAMTKDFEELGITVKRITSTLNDDGSVKLNIKGLDKFENTVNAIKNVDVDGSVSDLGISISQSFNETEKAYKRLLSIQKEMGNIKFKIAGLDVDKNKDEIAELTSSLNRLGAEYNELFAKTSINLSDNQFESLIQEAIKAENKIELLEARIADAKSKLANDIKINIELGNYEDDLTNMYAKLDKLSKKTPELSNALEWVENAYKELNAASELNEDGVLDTERLIQAQERYANAIEKTTNLINKQARAEAQTARADKLDNDIKLFQADIDRWLVNNSAATKQFGSQMLELRAKAEGVDRVKLNNLIQQFKLLDKQADKAGLKMMSTVDRIKTKAKEYMAYFSVAEVFMELTQALRAMFDTVVEIDTAMTGLYRVTDLTASQYDTLFDNMISSAKEYGATLNDIINATTDWVRAGFDANTSLGLAEVTTMYQHISDLDYDTAAENLITAYNGFKDELNTAFNGDTVASVEYIADIFNELDRHNCP